MPNLLSNSRVEQFISLNLGLLKSCGSCLRQSLKNSPSDDKMGVMTQLASQVWSQLGNNYSAFLTD